MPNFYDVVREVVRKVQWPTEEQMDAAVAAVDDYEATAIGAHDQALADAADTTTTEPKDGQ